MTQVFDEYGNYIYPTDVRLDEPNTATSIIPQRMDYEVFIPYSVKQKTYKMLNEVLKRGHK